MALETIPTLFIVLDMALRRKHRQNGLEVNASHVECTTFILEVLYTAIVPLTLILRPRQSFNSCLAVCMIPSLSSALPITGDTTHSTATAVLLVFEELFASVGCLPRKQ